MTATSQATRIAARCPECGMALNSDSPHCWLCGQSARTAAPTTRCGIVGRRWPGSSGAFRFQLDTLLLTVTLLSVLLAIARVAPGPTFPLLILVACAYLRTGHLILERDDPGRRLPRHKVVVFVRSLLIFGIAMLAGLGTLVTVVSASVGCAWLITYLVGFETAQIIEIGHLALGSSAVLGIFLALATAAGLVTRFWRWGE